MYSSRNLPASRSASRRTSSSSRAVLGSRAPAVMVGARSRCAFASRRMAAMLTAVADLLRGGKRLRAAFLYWGHRAAGRPDSDALVRLASAMELSRPPRSSTTT